MFVLRNIINHELYADDVELDGEFLHGATGWDHEDDADGQLHGTIKDKVGKYHVDDWVVISIDDETYYKINHYLNNDSDLKVFYYDNGTFEILNTLTGKVKSYEREE